MAKSNVTSHQSYNVLITRYKKENVLEQRKHIAPLSYSIVKANEYGKWFIIVKQTGNLSIFFYTLFAPMFECEYMLITNLCQHVSMDMDRALWKRGLMHVRKVSSQISLCN